MKKLLKKLEAANVSSYEYKEGGKLCGYELNTYTDGGVNQIVFVDFRNTDKDPKSEKDFKELFLARINSIDIDEEIELNRQNKSYKQDFTITESVKDFQSWKDGLLELANSL
jgi:hypothetical protein